MSVLYAKGLHPKDGVAVSVVMGFDQMLNHDDANGYFFNVFDERAVNLDEDSDTYNETGQIVQEGFLYGIGESAYEALKAQWQVQDVKISQPLRVRPAFSSLRHQEPCPQCGDGYLVKQDMHDTDWWCSRKPHCNYKSNPHAPS